MSISIDLSRTINLTILQRIGLENFLGQPVNPQAATNREESRVLNRVRTKVRIPTAGKRELVDRKVLVQQGSDLAVNDEAADRELPFPVHLETEEVYQLRRWGNELKHPNMVAILDWLEPLMEQLEARNDTRNDDARTDTRTEA